MTFYAKKTESLKEPLKALETQLGKEKIEFIAGTGYELGDWVTYDHSIGVAKQQKIVDDYEGKRSISEIHKPNRRVPEKGSDGDRGDDSIKNTSSQKRGERKQEKERQIELFEARALGRLEQALHDDSNPLASELLAVLKSGDIETARTHLRALDERLPEMLDAPHSREVWNDILASALMNGWAAGAEIQDGKIEDTRVLNAGTSDGARKGWETRRKNGWEPKRQREELGNYFDRVMAGEDKSWLDYAEVDASEATRLLAKTGVDVAGYRRTLDASAIKHIIKEHGDEETEGEKGQLPVTRSDFENLADYLKGADEVEGAGKTKEGLKLIRYYRDLPNGTTVVFEEVRSGRKKLVPKTMFKLKKKGWRQKK